MKYPRDDNDANADDQWHNVGCDASTVDVNWQQESQQACDKCQEAQLPIHLCDREQSHPERQDRTEEVAELQRAVRSNARPVF